jgi:chromosome segregation ATPase
LENERLQSDINSTSTATRTEEDEEIEELQHLNSELNGKVSTLQEQIERLNADYTFMHKSSKEKIDELERTVADLTNQIESEDDDSEKQKLHLINSQLRDRITELETDNKHLSQNLSELENTVADLTKLTTHVSTVSDKSSTVVSDLESRYSELEKKYKDGVKLVKTVEAQEKETSKKLQKAQKLLDEQQVELEERDHELSRLRKKLKKAESSDNSAQLETCITQFIDDEVSPLLSQAVFKNQQQFTAADLVSSRLLVLKPLLDKGALNRKYLSTVTQKLDDDLFAVLLRKPELESNDGFLAKMAVSVFENFIFDNLLSSEEKSGDQPEMTFFQRTRQCADICVLQQALVLHSDEMRQMVCPNLNIDEVREVCHKLGLAN